MVWRGGRDAMLSREEWEHQEENERRKEKGDVMCVRGRTGGRRKFEDEEG